MRPLRVEVNPPSPFSLPTGASMDGTIRRRGSHLVRFFVIDGVPVVVTASQPEPRTVRFAASAAPEPGPAEARAGEEQLERAIGRLRFALGVDEDLTGFLRGFRDDRLLGPIIRRRPDFRPQRQTSAWEALAWAVVGQLIEARRAAGIARGMVSRWGRRGPGGLADPPGPEVVAGRAPAELESLDLAASRGAGLVRLARDVASGRLDLAAPGVDRVLVGYPQVGPWTVQCLGLYGRGEADSLPAGDLDYLKIVGSLAGLGRRAEVAEVEELFEPYRPYRGLAGSFMRLAARSLRLW